MPSTYQETTTKILASITLTNENKGYQFSHWEEEIEDANTMTTGELFQLFQREYGRCVSRVYVDTMNDGTKAIGWYFESRQKYEDDDETYIRGAWVSVYQKAETHTYIGAA